MTRELDNTITVGSELLCQHGGRDRSTHNIVINEDKVLMGTITAKSGDLVTFRKTWDESGTPKSFAGKIRYMGVLGTPAEPASDVLPFYYVGNKIETTDWIGFVPYPFTATPIFIPGSSLQFYSWHSDSTGNDPTLVVPEAFGYQSNCVASFILAPTGIPAIDQRGYYDRRPNLTGAELRFYRNYTPPANFSELAWTMPATQLKYATGTAGNIMSFFQAGTETPNRTS